MTWRIRRQARAPERGRFTMSLADELKAEQAGVANRNTTAEWVAKWRPTLSAADRKVFDAWVIDPDKSATAIYRVVKNHGYPRAFKTFQNWIAAQRDNR